MCLIFSYSLLVLLYLCSGNLEVFPFFQISKKTLEEAIKSEFSGSIEDGLLAIGKNVLPFLYTQKMSMKASVKRNHKMWMYMT